MAWLDCAISALQSLSHQLDQLKALVIHGFMVAVQALILVSFVIWAIKKCWALAKTLLGV